MTSGALAPRAALVADLRRYQRRAILVASVRRAVAAVIIALGVAIPATIAWSPSASTGVAALMAVVLAAIAVAALAARLSAPDFRGTATVIDRALRSHDCLVTAVECLDASDPVADLVVREAARRLGAATPAGILPMEMPARLGTLAAVAGAIALGAIVLQNRQPQQARTSPEQARPASPSDGRNTAARGQRNVTPATQDQAGSVISSAPTAGARPEPGAAASAAGRNDNPSGRSGTEAESSRDPSSAPSTSSSSTANSATATNATLRADQSAGQQASASDRAGRGGQRGAAGDQSAVGGGGQSSGLASRTTVGAGGVNSGSDSASQTIPLQPFNSAGIDPHPSAAAVDAAWTRAQAAIAHDRVPSDLRQLVRDYFTAIRRARP